jgi:hypothetical protein
MTSNTEEHANPQAAAVRPPKATKPAHVAPHKRPVAPGKPRSERRPARPNGGPKAKRPPNRPNPPPVPARAARQPRSWAC